MNDLNREQRDNSANEEEKRRIAREELERRKAHEEKVRSKKEKQLLRTAVNLSNELSQAIDKSLPERLAKIVKTHAWIAVGCAFLPIPGLDLIAAAANIWTMYARINKEVDRPFADNMFSSIIIGIVTNVGSAMIVFLIIGAILKIVPGIGTITGVIVMACIIYSVTLGAGVVYLKAVTNLLQANNTSPVAENTSPVAEDPSPPKTEDFPERVRRSTSENPHLIYKASRGGQVFGPYRFDELKHYTLKGNIRPDDWLWHEGLDGWVTVRDFFLNRG